MDSLIIHIEYVFFILKILKNKDAIAETSESVA